MVFRGVANGGVRSPRRLAAAQRTHSVSSSPRGHEVPPR